MIVVNATSAAQINPDAHFTRGRWVCRGKITRLGARTVAIAVPALESAVGLQIEYY